MHCCEIFLNINSLKRYNHNRILVLKKKSSAKSVYVSLCYIAVYIKILINTHIDVYVYACKISRYICIKYVCMNFLLLMLLINSVLFIFVLYMTVTLIYIKKGLAVSMILVLNANFFSVFYFLKCLCLY